MSTVSLHHLTVIPISRFIQQTDHIGSPLSISPQMSSCLISKGNTFGESSIFRTLYGYRSGDIISTDHDTYTVLFNHDEFGDRIDEIGTIPMDYLVVPHRLSHGERYIKIDVSHNPRLSKDIIDHNRSQFLKEKRGQRNSRDKLRNSKDRSQRSDQSVEQDCNESKNIVADGYVMAGRSMYVGHGIGSGVNGYALETKDKGNKYPIYTPLTIHDSEHRSLISKASNIIVDMINEGEMNDLVIEKICWLINVVFYIDDYPRISTDLVKEAISNFYLAYTTFNKGTLLRQPINYVFDIHDIDGIYSMDSLCVSYIPTDFENVTYKTRK